VLSDTKRKHLIITGKNGSGKTSVLEAMRDKVRYEQELIRYDHGGTSRPVGLNNPDIEISFSHDIEYFSNFTFVYIPARRSQFTLPTAIEPIQIQEKTKITQNASKDFLKYILSLDYQLYGAKSDNNKVLEASLEKWFENFLEALRDIYDCKDVSLQRDTKNFAFKIEMPGREPFALHEMSDGYAAFLHIIMELLIRLESANAVVEYEKPAIVMIDEIEAHLHVELQRRILPFLTKMFPHIQFIVTTHSPFIITSLKNAVVYDLEMKERLENPSFYSYETVVESFLGASTYSEELIRYFNRYKELCLKQRTPEEHEEFLLAKAELEIRSIPSTELYIAFQNLEKRRKAEKNDSSQ
jgi:predicted ATPase